MPEWFCALQSALLNESATLFRRKYYNNGSHAGFILYMTDAAQNEEDIDALRTALKTAKGPGNFATCSSMRRTGRRRDPTDPGQRGGGQGRVRLDQEHQPRRPLAGLRVYPQLMGVVPQNAGGFGSISDAAAVWASLELEPMQARLQQVNELIGEEVVRFTALGLPSLR